MIAGVPYSTTDPFILRELPDVYIVGNQDQFAMEKRVIGGKEIVLVALPSFSSSGEAVMLNLRTLSVSTIRINAEDLEEKKVSVRKEEEEEGVVINEDITNEELYVC